MTESGSTSDATPSTRDQSMISEAWRQAHGVMPDAPANTPPPSERTDPIVDLAEIDTVGADSQQVTARDSKLDDSESPATDMIPGYSIIREIHRGGQGVVYLAHQKATRREVAIKILLPGPLSGIGDRMRFEREIQVLAQLKHPNIVTIHDSGVAAGQSYYVMDYIAGQSLDTHVAGLRSEFEQKSSRGRHRHDSQTALLRLFAKICHAVNAAHLLGVIHRDLKPGNVRVGEDGEPYILDFGLARVSTGARDTIDARQGISVTGQFLGSIPWASPEQAEMRPRSIDMRTDVYSLGVMLYQMLTGRFPYQVLGHWRDALENILSAQPTRPSSIRRQIDDEIETIVLKCLSKEPARRYQSAGSLATDIDRYLCGEPIEAKRDSSLYLLRKLALRHIFGTLAIISVLLILASAAFISQDFARQAHRAKIETDQRNQELLRTLQETEALGGAAREHHRRLQRSRLFAWFLLEWRTGSLRRARALERELNLLDKESSEANVAAFLLDDTQTPEELLERPNLNLAIVNFAVGERLLKQGRFEESTASFERALGSNPDPFLRETILARIHQLEAPNEGVTGE